MSRLSLVTGGNGFVGLELVTALQRRGDRVRVLDIGESARSEGVDYRQVDIRDREAVLRATEGAAVIFHTASAVHTKQSLRDEIFAINLGGTENLLDAAKANGVPRFVYVSSASVVYEGSDIEAGDESLPYARLSQAPYADSKIAAEELVLERNSQSCLTIAIRPHLIFGPGDTRFLPSILAKADQGILRFAIGRGRSLSDYTYIDNLIDALLLADEKLKGEAIAAGKAYFITNGEPMAFWEFIDKILERLDYPKILFRIPYSIAYSLAALKEWAEVLRGREASPDDGFTRFAINYMCTHHYFSIERARRELGYEPRISLEEGIERTCAAIEAAR